MPTSTPDPRPALREAQEWVALLIAGTRPEQLDAPTPCDEWNVRQLIGHLIAIANRITAMGEGADVRTTPDEASVPDGEAASVYREAIAKLWAVWGDDALMTKELIAPWGTVTGAQFLSGQTMEAVAHGWDLAVATGQQSEAPASAAGQAFATAQFAIPIEGRAGRPFAEATEAPADAGPTDRLAAYLGRKRP